MIGLRQLVEAGVQFGHVTSKRNPNMDPYIWGVKNRVNLIDVSKTALQLERAAAFLKDVAANGGQILWVGTKKVAQAAIKENAEKLEMPYVDHRWVGGTLSNHLQVKKSVTKLLHYEDVVARADKFPYYTKKELGSMQKHASRLEKIVGGIRKMTWPVGAVVLVDIGRTESALKEAAKMGIPVVALVDTNDDPSQVDYVVPANDDAASSVSLILNYLGNAAAEGVALVAQEREKRKAAAAKEREAAQKEKAAAPAIKPKRAAEEAADKKKAPVAKAKEAAPVRKSADKAVATKPVARETAAKKGPAAAKPAAASSTKKSFATTKKDAAKPAAATKSKAGSGDDVAASKKKAEDKK